jgi:hypothetical protein
MANRSTEVRARLVHDGAMLAMTEGKWLLISGSLVALLAIGVAIFTLWPSGPHGGLTREDAIRIARTHAGSQATSVISAEIRKDFNTGFDLPAHHWSWVVTFNGNWELICTGACSRTSQWVAIDYYTGQWIASEYAYPTALRAVEN